MILAVRRVIDLDLGHACQYGYHRPPIRVIDGPPDPTRWRSPTRAHLADVAIAALAYYDAMTTAELAAEIGTDQLTTLRPVLTTLTRRGEVEQLAAPRGRPCHWRLAA